MKYPIHKYVTSEAGLRWLNGQTRADFKVKNAVRYLAWILGVESSAIRLHLPTGQQAHGNMTVADLRQ
jgi:hypothetical protein